MCEAGLVECLSPEHVVTQVKGSKNYRMGERSKKNILHHDIGQNSLELQTGPRFSRHMQYSREASSRFKSKFAYVSNGEQQSVKNVSVKV